MASLSYAAQLELALPLTPGAMSVEEQASSLSTLRVKGSRGEDGNEEKCVK